MTAAPYQTAPGGVKVALRVTANASRTLIDGVLAAPDGARLKVRVAAQPERGKANAALLAVLAEAWGVPRRTLRLASGTATRDKTVLIAGASGPLIDRLTRWLERGHG